MSKFTQIKVRVRCRELLEDARVVAADLAGERGRHDMPPASWWLEASLSDLISFLALAFIQDEQSRVKRAAQREAKRLRRILDSRWKLADNGSLPPKESGDGSATGGDTPPAGPKA